MTSEHAFTHEVVVVQTPEERQQCFDMRLEVYHREQGFPSETEQDEWEDTATHFLLRMTPSLTPMGTIRAVKLPGKDYYKLTRLVVLQEYRKFKFGRVLVETFHDWIRQDVLKNSKGNDVKFVEIVCHSQTQAMGFYAKLGYEPEGPEFDEDGGPHQKMIYRMPLRPSS